MRLWVVISALAFFSACGDDEKPPVLNLPQKPQVFPSAAAVIFEQTAQALSAQDGIALNNGGRDNLVITNIEIINATAPVFQLGNVPTADRTVKSTAALFIPVTFNSPGRGVYLATLVIDSNAENFPHLEVEIIAPGTANPVPNSPDIVLFESNVDVIAELGNVAFVRFYNLGSPTSVLHINGYNLNNNTASAFAFPNGTPTPGAACVSTDLSACPGVGNCTNNVCDPVSLVGGSFIVLSVNYTPPAAGTHTVDVEIESDDPDSPSVSATVTGN